MKSYTIEQVYFKYHNLKRKAYLKRAWNKEATSYNINLERIRTASYLKLLSGSTLNDSERAMLAVMSSGRA